MDAGNDKAHISIDELSAFRDGLIEGAERRLEIENHLRECEQCRAEYQQLNAIVSLLSELPEPALPRSFRLRPEDVLPEPEIEPVAPWFIRYQSTFRVAAMAAVLVLALVVTIDISSVGDDSEDLAMLADQPIHEVAPDTEDAPALREEEPDEDVEDPGITSAEDIGDAVEDGPPDASAPEEESVSEEESAELSAPDMDEVQDGERSAAESAAFAEAADHTSDTWTTPRLLAIALAVLAVALLIIGFALPRWVGNPANRRS